MKLGTPLEEIVTPTEYYGLKAIGKRMGWSQRKVKNMSVKYHYPLVRLPARTRRGWSYYCNELLIAAWYMGLVQNTRRYLLQPHKTGTDRLREKLEPVSYAVQPIDKPSLSSIQESPLIHTPSPTSDSYSLDANEINELASRDGEGGGL